MKWRHWAILIVLVLLNYIVFSAAFTHMAAQRRPLHVTHTPMPTFTAVAAGPVSWVVLPTSTPLSTGAANAPPLPVVSVEPLPSPTDATVTAGVVSTETTEVAVAMSPTAMATATSTPTPASSPTQAPTTELVVHTVKRGE
ncbi:MAG: hypothetical protein JXA93_16110, partial [Anaerolineae bacterium]|nr:hypothetical protein [Anaerolineae bacterium]